MPNNGVKILFSISFCFVKLVALFFFWKGFGWDLAFHYSLGHFVNNLFHPASLIFVTNAIFFKNLSQNDYL